MKIDPLNTPFLNNEAKAAEARGKEKAPVQAQEEQARAEDSKGDVVRLSDRSRLIARAQELAVNAPEVRQAKIDELKASINAGTYDVSGRTVAEAMIRKSITEV